ncbi:MAG TPA: pyruvate, water dikinase regulatory protein [Thermohalobaculum sp.]|nr:pyruvate, water dikinase regulatory protein [Thermohalobaculum sp.]
MTDSSDFHLHLISDSTGETLDALARAALAPFVSQVKVAIHLSVFVRTARDVETALAGIRANPGLVWFTVVDPAVQIQIEDACAALGVESEGVLDPLMAMLARFIGQTPSHRPGMQHRMNNDYFDRIAALDYAIAHDDGAHDTGAHNTGLLGQRLRRADVILTGISRTSKTPTCVYLAYRGVKAANVPLVPNRDPPPELFEAMAAGVPVIGLTASPSRLAHVRSHRLASLGQPFGQPGTADYADLDRVRAEVADARLFFQRHHITVIDVTRRSIEETAAEILAVLRARHAAVEPPEHGA